MRVHHESSFCLLNFKITLSLEFLEKKFKLFHIISNAFYVFIRSGSLGLEGGGGGGFPFLPEISFSFLCSSCLSRAFFLNPSINLHSTPDIYSIQYCVWFQLFSLFLWFLLILFFVFNLLYSGYIRFGCWLEWIYVYIWWPVYAWYGSKVYLTKMTIKSWKSRRRDWLLTYLSWTNQPIDYRLNQWEQSLKSRVQSEYREYQLYSIFENINDIDSRAFLW